MSWLIMPKFILGVDKQAKHMRPNTTRTLHSYGSSYTVLRLDILTLSTLGGRFSPPPPQKKEFF